MLPRLYVKVTLALDALEVHALCDEWASITVNVKLYGPYCWYHAEVFRGNPLGV